MRCIAARSTHHLSEAGHMVRAAVLSHCGGRLSARPSSLRGAGGTGTPLHKMGASVAQLCWLNPRVPNGGVLVSSGFAKPGAAALSGAVVRGSLRAVPRDDQVEPTAPALRNSISCCCLGSPVATPLAEDPRSHLVGGSPWTQHQVPAHLCRRSRMKGGPT